MEMESNGGSSSTGFSGASVEHWRLSSSDTDDFYLESTLKTPNWQVEAMSDAEIENNLKQFRKRRSDHLDQEMDGERSRGSCSTEDNGPCTKYQRILDSPETVIDLDEIHEQLNDFFEPEEDILDNLEAPEQTLDLLELRPVGAMEAQPAPEFHYSLEKIELQRKNTELLNENANLREFMDRQITDYASKLNTAESIIIMLQQDINANSLDQKLSEFRAAELQKARVKIYALESEKLLFWKQIQDLYPKAIRTTELEKELLLAKETISNLRGSVAREVTPGYESCSCPGESENEVKDIKYEGFGLNLQQEVVPATVEPSQSIENDSSTSSHNEQIPGEVSDQQAAGVERLEHNEHIRVGIKGLYVLASHPTEKFSNFNFKACYRKYGAVQYECKMCLSMKKTFVSIVDHIWVAHCKGKFGCPLCINPPGYYKADRYKVTAHIRQAHYNLI